jgi:hypothetical protein
MTWFTTILNVITTAVTIGDRLYVRIAPCVCGKAGARLDRNTRGEWFVFCPYGCRWPSTPAKTRRRAKKNWNEEMEVGG